MCVKFVFRMRSDSDHSNKALQGPTSNTRD
jgi:hypothetical protein